MLSLPCTYLASTRVCVPTPLHSAQQQQNCPVGLFAALPKRSVTVPRDEATAPLQDVPFLFAVLFNPLCTETGSFSHAFGEVGDYDEACDADMTQQFSQIERVQVFPYFPSAKESSAVRTQEATAVVVDDVTSNSSGCSDRGISGSSAGPPLSSSSPSPSSLWSEVVLRITEESFQPSYFLQEVMRTAEEFHEKLSSHNAAAAGPLPPPTAFPDAVLYCFEATWATLMTAVQTSSSSNTPPSNNASPPPPAASLRLPVLLSCTSSSLASSTISVVPISWEEIFRPPPPTKAAPVARSSSQSQGERVEGSRDPIQHATTEQEAKTPPYVGPSLPACVVSFQRLAVQQQYVKQRFEQRREAHRLRHGISLWTPFGDSNAAATTHSSSRTTATRNTVTTEEIVTGVTKRRCGSATAVAPNPSLYETTKMKKVGIMMKTNERDSQVKRKEHGEAVNTPSGSKTSFSKARPGVPAAAPSTSFGASTHVVKKNSGTTEQLSSSMGGATSSGVRNTGGSLWDASYL